MQVALPEHKHKFVATSRPAPKDVPVANEFLDLQKSFIQLTLSFCQTVNMFVADVDKKTERKRIE